MEISMQVWVIAGCVLAATLSVLLVVTRMYRIVGPNTALVVTGLRGMRMVKGGGTIVLPLVEQSRELSLELMSFDVAPTQDNYTKQGVAVTVEAVSQIKVRSDLESIHTAAEQFLTKEPAAREGLIRLVMEGHLRGIIGQLTVEQIAKQAEAQRDLDIKRASYLETVKKQQATADKAYEIQTNIMQQQVIVEAVKVQQVEREQQVLVQEAEILRVEKELVATVLKQAEIERQRIETLATAERQRLISEAEGNATAIRVQGEAEAEIVFKKGEAEAKAMNIKAE